jgi:hypothetical protein
MFAVLGLVRGFTRFLPSASALSAVPFVAATPKQSTEGALMETAEACAGFDLRHAQELRRAAMVLLGVSR